MVIHIQSNEINNVTSRHGKENGSVYIIIQVYDYKDRKYKNTMTTKPFQKQIH